MGPKDVASRCQLPKQPSAVGFSREDALVLQPVPETLCGDTHGAPPVLTVRLRLVRMVYNVQCVRKRHLCGYVHRDRRLQWKDQPPRGQEGEPSGKGVMTPTASLSMSTLSRLCRSCCSL